MEKDELEGYTQSLLSAALRRCGDLNDARDLTQETLLAALTFLSRGGRIEDPRAWLMSVLARKHNDLLRRRYRRSEVSIGQLPDLPDTAPGEDDTAEDAESVRRAVAYLAGIYREVIVRHYLEGQDVRQIAAELGIPEGTVKSRLRTGREQLRKGFDDMEKYSKQSYAPVTLSISFCGGPGLNGEPCTLVENDLLAQNVLWCAYPRPATPSEIAQALGVPAAYLEPVLRRLTAGGLMVRSGSKFRTDFTISTTEDMERHIPAQKALVRDSFPLFWDPVDACLAALRSAPFYGRFTFDERNSLELYAAFNCLDYGVLSAFSQATDTGPAVPDIPDRPNGGRWIAMGHVNTRAFDPAAHADLIAHSYSGERVVRNGAFAGTGFEMHAYGPEGFPGYAYWRSLDYTFIPESSMVDPEIAKLLCVIRSGLAPESAGLDPEYLRAVPWLKKCGLLREENGRPAVNVPVLTPGEAALLWDSCARAHRELAEALREPLARFLPGRAQRLPSHLTGVPVQKQYMYAYHALVFASVRRALSLGRLHDGGYDRGAQYPCPMVLVI